MYFPSKTDFLKLSKKGNLIPVYKEILGDLDTPVSAYMKIAKGAKYSYLLESVEGEEKVARFSFVARNPQMIIESKDNKITISSLSEKGIKKEKFDIENTPLDYVRQILKEYKTVNVAGLPSFYGGIVGFLSYDIVRFFENLPNKNKDDLKIPDMLLILTKDLIVFDHINHKIKVVSCVHLRDKQSDTQKVSDYKNAQKRIEKLIFDLNKPLPIQKNKDGLKSQKPVELVLKSNFSKAEFENIVTQAKKDIRAGEIIQTVLSQRFEVDIKTDPLNIYRSLRALNPSPYMFYLNLDEIKLVGASPELLVRCENGIVETRPIAGTRPRGATEQKDEAYKKDLLKDPKEIAEHIMLVDLGRNDLGRVCKKGSVTVSEFMNVEKYSHVMHIVSNVKGELDQSKNDSLDVLQAAFPAGTLSGAPKIRAMEIIENLENRKRGPYGGCIGYFSFSGNLDTCITIRTIVIKDKKAYIQAGAGIVADSNPAKEYQETINKAKAQIKAIELAHSQFS